MFRVEITDKDSYLDKKKKELIKKISQEIFRSEKLKGTIIFELIVIDDKESHEINKKYRNVNRPTDVISFSFWEEGLLKTNLLGEIYLNYNKLEFQAKEYEHSIERELAFLISHGLFHLLGYDHKTKKEEEIMLSKQYKILDRFNLGRDIDVKEGRK